MAKAHVARPDSLRLYAGGDRNGLQFRDLVLQIDGLPSAHFVLEGALPQSLQDGGLFLLASVPLAPGAHRLRVSYHLRLDDAGPDSPGIIGVADQSFTTGPATNYVELFPAPPGALRVGDPSVQLRSWSFASTQPTRVGRVAAGTFLEGSISDPRMREVMLLSTLHCHVLATAHLVAMQDEHPDLVDNEEFQQHLAVEFGALGLGERATAIDTRLSGSEDPAIAFVARLRRAEHEFAVGNFAAATEVLPPVASGMTKGLRSARDDELARVLIAEGRLDEAASVVEQNGDPSDGLLETRYNLGVALIEAGKMVRGVTLLDRLAKVGDQETGLSGLFDFTTADPEALSIRDRANATLGYYYLRSLQNKSALPVFGRIRSPGPYASAGLLGLGWASLGVDFESKTAIQHADAALQPAGNAGDLAMLRRRLTPTFRTVADKKQEAHLREALSPWTELVGRDPTDPAVEEGLVAIPALFNAAGAFDDARRFYERAAGTLDENRDRIVSAIEQVRRDGLVDVVFPPGDAPSEPLSLSDEYSWYPNYLVRANAPDTGYLKNLIGDPSFHESLVRYARLRLLGEAMRHPPAEATHDTAVPNGPRAQLAVALAAARDDLNLNAVRVLEELRRQSDRYAVEAQFSLARMFDGPSGGRP